MLFALLEQLFPTRADYRLVRELSADDLLRHLQPTIDGEIVSLLPFNEPMVRATIHEAKFHHNEKAWRMLGEVLAAYLKHYQAGTVILPIPLSSQRQRERGYNQVTEVAKRAEKTLPYLALRTDILFRRQNTAPQTSLAKAERLSNVAGGFGAHHQDHLSGRHFIILDDVATTGATLKAARASLAPHRPASITLLSLAH